LTNPVIFDKYITKMDDNQRQAEIKRLEKELAELEAKKARIPLLSRFIGDKEKDYVEPSRKGKKRGEKIGSPKTKYVAALSMLHDMPDKDRAKMAKVSYGLLLKWKTEKDFQNLVIALAFEYAAAFIKRVEERAIESQEMFNKFIKDTPTDKLRDSDPPQLDYSEFRGVHQYSLITIKAIATELPLLKDNIPARVEALNILGFDSAYKILHLWLDSSIIDNTIEVLTGKKVLDEQDNKSLIYVLSSMSKSFEHGADKLLEQSGKLFDKKLKGAANDTHIFEKSISEAQEPASVPA
jgi:hypothetical protein